MSVLDGKIYDRDDISISFYEAMSKRYKNYPVIIKISSIHGTVHESGGLIDSEEKKGNKYLLSKDDIKELILFGIEYGASTYGRVE